MIGDIIIQYDTPRIIECKTMECNAMGVDVW